MELIERLSAANQIITRARACFDSAAMQRNSAEIALRNARTNRRVINGMVINGAICFYGGALIIIDDTFRIRSNLVVALIMIPLLVAMIILVKKIISRPSHGAQRAYDEGMQLALRDEEEGKRIIDANRNLLSFLPYEYWYPMATEYILRMVQTGRAKTINEALVLYDEYLHRWKIENANAAIVANQQAQTYALQGIRKSSAVSAAANVASAAANIGRLFS